MPLSDNREIDGIVVLLIRKTSIEFHRGILIFPDVVCRKLKDNRTLADLLIYIVVGPLS
ncbi:MAG: hypothetical protein U0941_14490 [Planctomycetaceae bacterium]